MVVLVAYEYLVRRNSTQSVLVMGLGMGLDRYVCIWENLHLPEFVSSLLVLGEEFKTK